jgi:hypothetical protein
MYNSTTYIFKGCSKIIIYTLGRLLNPCELRSHKLKTMQMYMNVTFNKKWLNYLVLKSTLIICISILCNHSLIAQNLANSLNTTSPDTNSITKQKLGFWGFFKRLFHNYDKKPSENYVRHKNKSDSTASEKSRKPEPFELTRGGVTWTSLYTEGVNLNTGINGLYSLGHLSQGFDVYGAPFTGQGIGVFDNGQFERSYSSYSLNFDPDAYLNSLRKRAENIMANKKNHGKTPNLSDSLNAYESIREKLTSPSYQSEESTCKSQFQKDEDSLQKHPGRDTTELHNLRKKLYTYEQLEKRYQELFGIKKNYNTLTSDTAGKKEEKLLSNPNNLEKVLEQNHQLSEYEKFLMGVQKFSIGQSGEEISEFTLHDFMMNGINAGYKSGDMYNYFGYGKEVAVVNPFLMTGINVPEYHRTVEFVRSGEGPENGSNFYITIIKISDPGSSSSLNETNWIFDVTKKVVIGKNVDFEAEFAKSTFSYISGKLDSAALPFTPQTNNTLAYALRGKGTLPGLRTTLKAEVSQTGGDFVTLGNPYLITGATKYEAELSQPLGQKLIFDIGGTHVLENRLTPDGTRQTDNWIEFSFQYKPTKLINMDFKYSPREFQEESGTVVANNVTSNINQISFTGNMSSQIFNEKMTTTVFAGNFQYNTTQLSDLLNQNLNLAYYMISELLVLSPTQGINVSVDESRNNWTGGLSQFIGQSTYNWNMMKSFMMAMGPEWIEQPGVTPNEVGLVSSVSSSIQKWSRIGIQLTYRNTIEKPISATSQCLISGNVSILW